MKQIKLISKRATSGFMAFVIAFVTVVTVTGGVFIAKSLAAPAQTIVSLPINEGDKAISPNFQDTCWGNDDDIVDGSGVFADEGAHSSYLYRLLLGDGKTFGDAYCGNYGLSAWEDVEYTVKEVVKGKTKVDAETTINEKTYNIIRAVVTANNKSTNASALAYTAGQLTIWRALYLEKNGNATYNADKFINEKMKTQLKALAKHEEVDSTASQIIKQMKAYLTAAEDGSYSEYPLYIWDCGKPGHQLLFTGGNIDTKEEHGYIELTKTSTYNGEVVGGATYGVYTNKSCTKKVDQFTTDSNGYGKSNALVTKEADGTVNSFWVKEISCKKNYEVSTQVYSNNGTGITIKDGKTYTLGTAKNQAVQDDPISASIYVYKLNSEDESTATTYTDDDLKKIALSGATFVVDEWSIADATYKEYCTMTYDSETKRYNAKLYYSSDNGGRFRVRETVAPEGYLLDSTSKKFYLTAEAGERDGFTNILKNEEKRVLVYDKPVCGTVELSKNDSESGKVITGTTFKLQEYDSGSKSYIDYKEDGNLVTLSYENGVYVSGLLYYTEANGGKFRIVETATDGKHSMPQYDSSAGGYVVNEFALTEYNQKISVSATNDPIIANIEVQKLETDSGEFTSQGDADITKTVIGLYADERIVSTDGKTIWEKDQLITKQQVNATGAVQFAGYPLGKYYVKEVEAGPGFVLDTTKHEVDVSSMYDALGETEKHTTSILSASVTIYNTLKKQPFSVYKINDDEDGAKELQGAGFSAYLISSLQRNEDGTYNYDSANPVILTEDGKTEIFTDANGSFTTVALPYGSYIVRETTIPKNHWAVPDFTVVVSEDSPSVAQRFTKVDSMYRAHLQILKKDARTGELVTTDTASFKLLNVATGVYYEENGSDVLTTNKKGEVYLQEKLKPGTYMLTEVEAPEGYATLLEGQSIVVDDSTNDNGLAEDGYPLYVLEVEDAPLTVELSKKDITSGEEIVGATLQVISVAKDGTETVYEEWVSTKTPHVIERIPSGDYILREILAPTADGYVKASDVSFTVEDTGIRQQVTMYDDYTKVQVDKVSFADGKPVLGAELAIYEAKLDDKGEYIVKEDGTYELGDEYARWVTDGTSYTMDYVPTGKYVLVEKTAPFGYLVSEMVPFEVTESSEILKVEMLDDVPYGYIEINKRDEDSELPMEGVEFTIYDLSGDIVQVLVTDADGHAKSDALRILDYDENGVAVAYRKYTVKETKSLYGYIPDSKEYDVVFRLAQPGPEDAESDQKEEEKVEDEYAFSSELYEYVTIDKALTYDVVTKNHINSSEITNKPIYGVIQFQKIGDGVTGSTQYETVYGEITRLSFGEKYLAGVEFTIYRDESLTDVVETVVTDENGAVSSSPLRCGTYYVKETKTPKGYAPDHVTHAVEITPDEENSPLIDVSYDCVNHVCGVQINLWKVGNVLTINSTGEGSYDTEKLAPLAGVVFGIYTNEDFYDFSGENLIMPKGTLVGAIKTGDDGRASLNESLLAGKYYYQELATLAGYEIDNEKYEFEVSLENEDVAEFNLNKENPNINYFIKGSRVTLYKVDRHTGASLGGVEFALMNERGQLMGTYVTDDETGTIVIEDLPYGNYLFKELKAQDYYLLGEVVIPFTINEGSDLKLEVKATNERISLPALGLVDKDTALAINIIFIGSIGLVLVGVSFVIYWIVKKRKVVRQ